MHDAMEEICSTELVRLRSIEAAARALMPSLANLRVDLEPWRGVVNLHTYNAGAAKLLERRIHRIGRVLDIHPYNMKVPRRRRTLVG